MIFLFRIFDEHAYAKELHLDLKQLQLWNAGIKDRWGPSFNMYKAFTSFQDTIVTPEYNSNHGLAQ